MEGKVSNTIILTDDGSPTILSGRYGASYHSTHGAVQESNHVFLKSGLDHLLGLGKRDLKVFEMGFGSGLNAWLTSAKSVKDEISIEYHTIELFPLDKLGITEYARQLGVLEPDDFWKIHDAAWDGKENLVNSNFSITKYNASLIEMNLPCDIDVVFYDAFAPSAQPELWTAEVFQKIFRAMNYGAILVTYCCKGDVRRAMMTVGFDVQKIPGPPGKREMIRATKPLTEKLNS